MSLKFVHTKENKDGELKALATRENLECLMRYKKVSIAYDLIKKRPIIRNVKSLKGEEENSLIAFLKSQCGLFGLNKSLVDEQLSAIMQDNAVNPVVDCIKKLKRTKEHNPIHELIDSLPIKNKVWAKTAFHRWLIQCVAAADCAKNSVNKHALPKYESVLTFYGDQGLLKTAFIRSIMPVEIREYLKDGILLDLNKNDSKVEALSSWITELGELDSTFKKSDISALKAFLSRQEDEIRRPYAKAASILPRSTSFFASVNEERFLRDSTGNRRYLPITINDKLMVSDSFDISDLWAYIWKEYTNGEQWWLTSEEEILQENTLKLHEDNSIEEILLDEFIFEESYRGLKLTGNVILDSIKFPRSRANSTSIGSALKKLDIHKNSSREYIMPKFRKFLNTT